MLHSMIFTSLRPNMIDNITRPKTGSRHTILGKKHGEIIICSIAHDQMYHNTVGHLVYSVVQLGLAIISDDVFPFLLTKL